MGTFPLIKGWNEFVESHIEGMTVVKLSELKEAVDMGSSLFKMELMIH